MIEAMACDTPIVSTDCPSGPAEISEGGRYRRLVPFGDADAMAKAMNEALSAEHVAEALKRRAADFAPERIADRFQQFPFPNSPRRIADSPFRGALTHVRNCWDIVPSPGSEAFAPIGAMTSALYRRVPTRARPSLTPPRASRWVIAGSRSSNYRSAARTHALACGRYVIVFNGEIYNHLDLDGSWRLPAVAWRGTSTPRRCSNVSSSSAFRRR